MRIVSVNAGSSSLKLRLLEGDRVVADRNVQRWDGAVEPVAEFLRGQRVDGIGHRFVHGGERITGPTVVDEEVADYLASLTDLAPLHQPHSLAGLAAARTAAPSIPSVVCVDTAFHRTIPEPATTYALPREWNRRWSLRRYGFHGLSHAHAVSRGAELTGAGGRVLSCHLGAGCSLAAVRDGRCVDTTMGFTPEEGLVMTTRSGSLDPGLLRWLLDSCPLDPDEVFDAVRSRSGLAGLSGLSGDLRDVFAARERGSRDAALAFDVFRHSLTRHAGAMIAVLGGLDLLVFTGGIGEHQPLVRASLCRDLAFVGVAVDERRNEVVEPDAEITSAHAPVRTVVVEAREDLRIAREVRAVLAP